MATRQNRGSTLIELLVVLMIMGLLLGLVSTIARPDDRAQLRVEVDRLAQLMDLAATESRLTGREIAWTADRSGYRFWQFHEESGWLEIVDNDLLRPRRLPSGMTISKMQEENLRPLEHMRVEFNAYDSERGFRIEMSLGEARLTIAKSPIGDVFVLPEGAG